MFLGLIGDAKQAQRRFPMDYLKSTEFTCRGDFYVLLSEEGNEGVPELIVFAWVVCCRR